MEGQSHRGRTASANSLIGRQAELAVLRDGFRLAADGSTNVVLVSGEAGIGKTRLINVFGAEAASNGAIVLRGTATQAEGMPPYFPFMDALGRYIRVAGPDALRTQVGNRAGILSTILPDLPAIIGAPPPSYLLPPEQARYRLCEAVGELLTAIGGDRPLVLTLDDVQWADRASLDLLLHIARREPETCVLLVGAYRRSEAGQNPTLSGAIAELSRLRVLTTVTLDPFSDEDMAALASTYLGGAVSDRASRLVQERSEGNPFIAEELLRAWRESGLLAQHDECWDVALCRPAGIPDTISAAIRHRLDRLPPETVELLRTAAIIGRTFDSELVADATGQEGETVEDRLLAAERAELLRSSVEGAYIFAHDLIREHLYAEVTPLRRKRLHGFIGHALETRACHRDAKRAAELAFHFSRSGDRSRGARYADLAAQQAMDTYAFTEAVGYYHAAVELLNTDDVHRAELLLALGDAAILAGSEPEAVPAFYEARQWFLEVGDYESAARAAHGLGQAWWRQDEFAQAHAGLEVAVTLLQGTENALAVRVLVDCATLLAVSLGKQAEGLAHADRALEIARRLGDERLEASASRTLGNLLVRSNNALDGLPLLERALQIAEATDDPAEAAECCSCLALAYMWTGKLRRSLEMIDRRLAHAERSHDLYQLRHAHTWRVGSAMWLGNWNEAERLLNEAQAIAERLAGAEPLAFVYNMRGAVAWWRGDYEAAEAWFTRATAIFRGMGPMVLVWYLAPLGTVQLALGKRSQALACVTEVEALVEALPPDTIQAADPLVYLSLMAVELGDRERAERYYARLLPFSGLHIDFLVDRVLGELATLLRKWEAARTHLTAAEVTARQEGDKASLAFTLEAKANLDIAMGGGKPRKHVQQLLRDAHSLFEDYGMLGEARRVAARLADLSRERGRRKAPLPANLSTREAEVLRLVAAGRTNRQIAEDLFISEKTVINHLTSILTKTGADNRAGAAAFAVRHGLV